MIQLMKKMFQQRDVYEIKRVITGTDLQALTAVFSWHVL